MNMTLAEERFVLGLDVGTQSLRAALFDLQGRSVAFGAHLSTRPFRAPPGPSKIPPSGGSRPVPQSKGAGAGDRCARAVGRDRPGLHGLHGGGSKATIASEPRARKLAQQPHHSPDQTGGSGDLAQVIDGADADENRDRGQDNADLEAGDAQGKLMVLVIA